MKNKITFLSLLGLVMFPLFAIASNENQIIISSDGARSEYFLAYDEEITFAKNAEKTYMKLLDADGRLISNADTLIFSTDIPTSLPENIEQEIEAYFVYPNPVSNTLYVEHGEGIDNITVINMAGQTMPVEITTENNKSAINVTALAQGNYLVIVGDKSVKFIKK